MAEEKDLGRKIATNSLVSVLTAGTYMLSRLALTPFILSYISLEEFGLWGVCFTILGYALVNGPGIQGAFIKYSAEFASDGDHSKLNRLLSTGLLTMAMVCSVCFLLMVALLPILLDLFKVEPGLKDTAQFLILGTTAAFMLDALFSPFYAILSGLQEIAKLRLIWLAASIVELGLIVCLVLNSWGVSSLLLAYITRILIQTVAYVLFAYRRIPALQMHPKLFCRSLLGTLFSFGGRVQFISLLAMFMNTFDKLVATSFFGLGAAGLFEVGQKFPKTGQLVVSPVFAPLLPAASHYRGHWSQLEESTARARGQRYLRLSALSLAIGLLGITYPLILYTHSFLSLVAILIAALLVAPLIPWLKNGFSRKEKLESPEIRQLYLTAARHATLLNVSAMGLCAASAPALIFAWVGEGYEKAYGLMVLVSLSCLVNLLTGPGTQVFQGSNRTGREFEYLMTQIILAAIWVPSFSSIWGLQGAVLGTLSALIVSCTYFLWQTHRCLSIAPKEYLQQVIFPSCVPAVLSLAAAYTVFQLPFLSRWETLAQLSALGALFFLLNGVILKIWVLSDEEWTTFLAIILRKKVAKSQY